MTQDRILKLVRRWAVIVLGLAVAAAALTYVVAKSQTKIYKSGGLLLVSQAPRSSSSAFQITVNQITETYATLVKSPEVLDEVIADLKLGVSDETLARSITVSPQANSELIAVDVSDPDPQRATLIANALLDDFVARVSADNQAKVAKAGAALTQQMSTVQRAILGEQAQLAAPGADKAGLQSEISANQALLDELSAQYSSFQAQQVQQLDAVSVAQHARLPIGPDSPRPLLDAVLIGLAALLLVSGAIGLVDHLDQSVRSEDDVTEKLGIATLAVIPRFSSSTRRGRRHDPGAAHSQYLAEAYRRLRTNILFTGVERPLKSLVVTSAREGEGKTMTSANLAGIVAAAGESVLVVDADMRRPRQHLLFNRPLSHGFSEMLLDGSAGSNGYAAPTSHDSLRVMTAGTLPPNPAELLSSRSISGVVRNLEQAYDLVVFDTPPAALLSDASTLASLSSGTVLVVDASRANAKQVRSTIDKLRSNGADILGVVLNKAPARTLDRYAYYDYRHASSSNAAGGGSGGATGGKEWTPFLSADPPPAARTGGRYRLRPLWNQQAQASARDRNER